jgi:hypothetical protein
MPHVLSIEYPIAGLELLHRCSHRLYLPHMLITVSGGIYGEPVFSQQGMTLRAVGDAGVAGTYEYLRWLQRWWFTDIA